MVHTIDIKIRGYHLDVFGHVNNARYLEFMEEARWAAFEEKADFSLWAQKGYAFTVVNINIDYKRPAYLNETLRIETTIAGLKRHSGVIHQLIKLKGAETIVADAKVTFVLFDTTQKKAVLLKDDVLELLKTI